MKMMTETVNSKNMSPEEKEIMKMNKKLAQTRSTAGSEDCLHLSVHTPRV